MVLCALLAAAVMIGPLSASAASKNIIMILKTTVDGGRLREGPSSAYDVANGQEGYIYEGFLTPYGMVRLDQVYYAGGTTNVYKSPGGSRIGALGQGEHVLVFKTQGDWAFIKTLSGRAGFVQLSNLRGFT